MLEIRNQTMIFLALNDAMDNFKSTPYNLYKTVDFTLCWYTTSNQGILRIERGIAKNALLLDCPVDIQDELK